MNRRRFSSVMAALGFMPLRYLFKGAKLDAQAAGQPDLLQLSRNGWMPNNEKLPVLLYHQVFALHGDDPALLLEQTFRRNDWPPQWRNGVYDFHHYHSTAHEVLGFAVGHARLMLGGENGHDVVVHAGDVAVLPTGTGHCKLEASEDFLVVGAYPPNQIWDICRSAPTPAASDRMEHLPFPKWDPVAGVSGALVRAWRS